MPDAALAMLLACFLPIPCPCSRQRSSLCRHACSSIHCSDPANYDKWPQVPLILSVYAAVAGAITTPILAMTVLWRGSRYALPPPMMPEGQVQQQALVSDGAVLGSGAASTALVPVGTAPVGAAAAVAPQSVIPVVTAK